MANASIVYEAVPSSSGPSGNLFAGKKFWFSRTVPQSKRFKELVQSNGGAVVLLEKEADIRLTDHTRKDPAPDTYSYQYVEKSVRSGKLENLEDHRVGPPAGTIRPVGAAHIPARGHRVPFSARDDRILRDWMRPYEKARGSVSGNKIFQELEAKHPQHTSQSWRNRYLKVIRDASRPATPPSESTGQTTAPSKQSADDRPSKSKQSQRRSNAPRFTEDEKASLLQAADDIMSLSPSSLQKSWSNFANTTDKTSEQWQDFFNREVRPEYLARKSGKSPDRENSIPQSSTGEQLSPSKSPREKAKVPETKARKDSQATSSQRERGSPSSEPKSPSARRTKPVMSGALRRLARGTVDEQPSNDGRSTKSRRQEKRRRDHTPAAAGSQPPAESKRNGTSKRRKTAQAIAVEIPVIRPETTRPRVSLPSYKHTPSAQLLGSTDFIEPADVDTEPETSDKKGRSGSVSSSHSSHKTQQSDHFEDAQQFQETAVNVDLDIPQPPDSTDNYMVDLMKELPFQLPPIPLGLDEDDPSEATSEATNEEEQIHQTEEWMDLRLKSRKASNETQLIQALRCCSMEPNLADKVLVSLRAGKGIPNNMRGVWTAEDDEALHSGQGRDIERLLIKHGDDFYQRRQDYFRLLDEVEKG